METALIVTLTEKSMEYFVETMARAAIGQTVLLQSCAEARRLLLEREFDLVVINGPLREESGEELARDIAAKSTSQVILVVKSEIFEEVSSVCAREGILTVAKPISKSMFWSALMLAQSAHNRIEKINRENSKLKQKIEDIRIVDRAKCILVSYFNMSEQEAHRNIEKQAMDMRTTKRQVAEEILKTYDN